MTVFLAVSAVLLVCVFLFTFCVYKLMRMGSFTLASGCIMFLLLLIWAVFVYAGIMLRVQV